MGNSSNKSKKSNTNSKIGKEFECPLCNKNFSLETTFNQLNQHIINCAQNINRHISSTTNIENTTIINNNELNSPKIKNSTARETNKNFVNFFTKFSNISKEYQLSTTRSVSSVEKKSKEKISLKENDLPFEQKFQILRNNLEGIKIDWREAHCTIEINRENLLKDSMKNFESVDPYKVY